MPSQEVELSRTLKRVMPRSTAIVDYKSNGDGDAILLVHDSLTIRERVLWKDVWTWMKQLVGDECWIILGDFNMVETQEDSIGPSPVLKSDEKHVWDLCAGRMALIDVRLCATRILWPHFTRQAWHGFYQT
ncbi:hypothetical protein R1sor_002196 [Riccia sorocarpa]|uniref:Uncharacterized protein n=1 Tax=Riccia sorocarpa TaxID=122646 RepID=A0ABD3H228_9MARC